MFENKSIDQSITELNSNSKDGLTDAEVLTRQQMGGKNILEEKKKKSGFLIFVSQLNDPLIYILFAAIIISCVISEWVDAIIMLVVVLLNAIIGTIEECKAEKALDALKKMASPNCIVRRNGKVFEIKTEDLVIGDIVILETGRTIPADLRLLMSNNLKVDESSLTGESVSVEKDASKLLAENTPIGDCKNLAYMSTNVTYGRGEGIVYATGMNTQIGKIANMLNKEKDSQTPLQKKLAELGKLLGILTVAICVLIFIVALVQKRDALDMFMSAVSLAVAAIPEGLPAVVTIVLSIGVQKMVKANTIVRKLHSVETLGAVNVVCSDKTGTLTQNKMTVKKAATLNRVYNDEEFNSDLTLLIEGMMLNNDASIKDGNFVGDPTEIALLEMGKYINISKEEVDKKYPRIKEIPFDSERKMMSTMHTYNNQTLLFTKGAIDNIIVRCKSILIDGKEEKITEEMKAKLLAGSHEMAKDALRVLALAYKKSDVLSETDLVFVGYLGMIDPPRLEAKAAVESLKNAGVTTIMITGDHKDTAFAIAKELLIASDESQCLSGVEIDELGQVGLEENIYKYRVFARVSPENKVMIVKAFKAHGNIVAMTGDGVNDAPSLKAADIGISMGITGTDVAKSASDMILSDDNFASIEKAVKEGRGIYANIKKSLLFLLSSNIGEIIAMFLGILLNLPVPLLAIHILWVNLLTDSFPALALGQDENDENLMLDKPRSAKESLFAKGGIRIIIGYGILIGFITLGAFLLIPIIHLINANDLITWKGIVNLLNTNGAVLEKARTFAFCTLGVSQLFHSIGMKNLNKNSLNKNVFKNKLLWIAFIFGITIQILVTEVNFLNVAFGTTHLHFQDWLILIAFSMIPLVVHEVIHLIKHLFKKKKIAE